MFWGNKQGLMCVAKAIDFRVDQIREATQFLQVVKTIAEFISSRCVLYDSLASFFPARATTLGYLLRLILPRATPKASTTLSMREWW